MGTLAIAGYNLFQQSFKTTGHTPRRDNDNIDRALDAGWRQGWLTLVSRARKAPSSCRRVWCKAVCWLPRQGPYFPAAARPFPVGSSLVSQASGVCNAGYALDWRHQLANLAGGGIGGSAVLLGFAGHVNVCLACRKDGGGKCRIAINLPRAVGRSADNAPGRNGHIGRRERGKEAHEARTLPTALVAGAGKD